MSDKILVDTNLWVYLYSPASEKQIKMQAVVANEFQKLTISTQILGELYHVLTRKNLCTVQEAKEIIFEMVATFPVLEIETATVLQALDINTRYGYSYWDSLVVATALLNDCDSIYSEDMHHTQLIDQKLHLINPLT